MFAWKAGELNPEQEAAVTEEQSVFLTACPGSGKTRTLTYKAALELSKVGSNKQWVIAITYTHRAADEIAERIESMGIDTSRLWIGTLHSFCLEWVLKPYQIYHPALRHGFRVINGHDTEQQLAEICKPHRNPRITPWDCGHYYTPAGRVSSCAARIRDSVEEILDTYRANLLANRQIDFELMLSFAYELVRDNPPIGKVLASLFSWILIDEYQDTKEIQYAIVAEFLRAGDGKVRTFIVGDANQAIFSSLGGYAITAKEFRAMSNIQLREMALSRNYRSSARIVEYFGNYSVVPSSVSSVGQHMAYPSQISFNDAANREQLETELVRLIRRSIETLRIAPREVCVLAPQWVHLASMTRRLVEAMPEHRFDGPGMVPFARDIENFWYKVSKIVLTEASPGMYVRRLRWAGEILTNLDEAGVDISKISKKSFLRECNSIVVTETDGLEYLAQFFDQLLFRLRIDINSVPVLKEHHDAFFASSKARVERLRSDGAEFVGEIENFRKVFETRRGITVSTIHGVKGAEYDVVIAYALLEGMVPHFSDPDSTGSANRLLYVICSRARKNLHLIAERGRTRGNRGDEYEPTHVLAACQFSYDDA